MSTPFATPQTLREIAAVYNSIVRSKEDGHAARLQFWVNKFGDKLLADLSPEDADAGLAEIEATPSRRGGPRSGATINRYRMAIQSLIKFARQKRLLPRGWHSPFADIPQQKESSGKLRYLSLEEENKLLHAARLQQWVLLPLLIRLAIVTGLRKGALLGLTWGDVCLESDEPHVSVERTKNGDPHVSPLTDDLVAEFQRVRRASDHDTDLIFVGKYRTRPHNFTHCYRQAVKAAGIQGDVTFHTLRHTSCSRLAQAGVDILEIATHAGHRSLAMTRRYAHLSIKGRSKTVTRVFAA